MIKLTEADSILKNAYIDLVNKELKNPIKSTRVVCLKCGRGDKTLRKVANGYICNDCLRELEFKKRVNCGNATIIECEEFATSQTHLKELQNER